jgi:hypothetical protein
MKRSLFVFGVAVVAAALGAVAAAADGGPSPGVSYGWNGIVSSNGQVRYVAIPSNRATVVEAVRVLGGRVLRWTSIRGTYGVPVVAYDGSAGALSHDGRTLVLSSQTPGLASGARTRFVLLKTRSLRPQSSIVLRGSFSFDALSPDASTLYLIQYTSAQDYNRYRVRAYDVASQQLLPDAIVDKREPDEQMTGGPVTRLTTTDGRWAYTLYARQGKAPFVHALDTVERKAYCIDLPLRFTQQQQVGLRLRFHGEGRIDVRNRRTTVAVVDMEKLEARKG